MGVQLEVQKVENDKRDDEQTLRFKYWEQLLQADVKETELAIEREANQLSGSQADVGANGTGGPGQRDSD